MQNIHEWGQKIKFYFEDGVAEWGTVVIVFLVALSSFGLGRFSALEGAQTPVSIRQTPLVEQTTIAAGGYFVASKTGTVYYYPWCAGATKIAPQNQVLFQNEKEAQKAGYTPARNCKGLTAP
jgi:hypothetical protein